MNNRRAHEVLKEMRVSISELKLRLLPFGDKEIAADSDISEASVEGLFTADQLEAIATWMRDPKGVAEGIIVD